MRILATILFLIPGVAFAAGSGDSSAPKPTQTTKSCKGIKIWDDARGKCVNPQGSALDSDTLMDAVRELAYAGRSADAQGVLRAMPDQRADLVLTYWGFTHRKLGNLKLAHMFYADAIAQNPDNLLARSYLGQGLVDQGRQSEAFAQWQEIRARGGADSWPETALRRALETGISYDY